jgi:osmotically-inducible protein OsmY
MQRSGQVPDKQLCQKIQQRLSRTGMGSRSTISVQVRNGDVTMSGTLQHETQRRPILHAARGVSGVRQVVDQLQVRVAAKQRTVDASRPPVRR